MDSEPDIKKYIMPVIILSAGGERVNVLKHDLGAMSH